MIASSLLWVGLAAAFVGLVSVVKPLRFLGLRTRGSGALLALAAMGVAASAAFWPASVRRSRGSHAIDRYMPVYNFHEVHTTMVRASPEVVYRAIEEVRADEVRYLRPLLAIRRLGARPPQRPVDRPILEIATETSFVYLARRPPREIALGTIGKFWQTSGSASPRIASPEEFLAFKDPGFARAVMNFTVEPREEGRSRVRTETRIFVPDREARRRFSVYWRLIYPGSALIRVGWLEGVRQRAESTR